MNGSAAERGDWARVLVTREEEEARRILKSLGMHESSRSIARATELIESRGPAEARRVIARGGIR